MSETMSKEAAARIAELEAELAQKKAELKAAKEAEVAFMSFGEYNGSPTVTLNPKGKRPFTIGLTKVCVILDHGEEITAGVKNYLASKKSS